ncbi:MAG: hypothetical protein GSR84_06455 [Desulfurococcales archaeon]|nr:hypothetical protein [Desulfurococcales archaeon]
MDATPLLLQAASLHGPEAQLDPGNTTLQGDWWCPCMMGFGFMGGFMGLLWMILIIVIIAAVIYAIIGLARGVQQPQYQYPPDEVRRLREEIEELRRELRSREERGPP